MARVSKKRGERSGARSGLGSGRAGERMSTVLSGSAQPGAAAGLYSHSSQPYIQRLGIAGVSIQRLQAVPTPCRPLERAVPVPCQRAGIAAQARARGRAVLGTGTGEAGRAVFVPGQISIVPVLARWAWPVWKSLAQSPGPRCHRTPTARRARRHPRHQIRGEVAVSGPRGLGPGVSYSPPAILAVTNSKLLENTNISIATTVH